MKFCHLYDIEIDDSYQLEIVIFLILSTCYFCLDWRNFSFYLTAKQPRDFYIQL